MAEKNITSIKKNKPITIKTKQGFNLLNSLL